MKSWILGFALVTAGAAGCDLRPARSGAGSAPAKSPAPASAVTGGGAVRAPVAPGEGCSVTLAIDGMT